MSWIFAILLAWILHSRIQAVLAWLQRPRAEEPALFKGLHYGFDSRRNWVLSLAHPLALAHGVTGFAATDVLPTDPAMVQSFRPALLHVFGLRNSLNDAELRQALGQKLRSHWFQIDLEALRPQDDPRDALAFACARLTFAVRMVTLLGWLDEETQWYVLYQNAQRANECFSSWLDYAGAWSRGRKQWVSSSRADSLGVAFSEQQVHAWLADVSHPWSQWPWNVPPLFQVTT